MKKIYHSSLKGDYRETNEDTHTIVTNISGKNRNLPKIDYISVYDGHGGSSVSQCLKKYFWKHFFSKNKTYPLKKNAVEDIFKNMTILLKKQLGNEARETGSTANVVIIYEKDNEKYLQVFNVGDSRSIICRKNNITHALSKDHKPGIFDEFHRIQKLGGKVYFDGNDWRIEYLSVSRAFGDFDSHPYVTYKPECFSYKLKHGDKFLIVACDGLWDVVTNDDATNFVLNMCYDSYGKRINKPHLNISQKLAEYAISKGSTDNVSVIVYFI